MRSQLSFVSVSIHTRTPQILQLIHIRNPARKKNNNKTPRVPAGIEPIACT